MHLDIYEYTPRETGASDQTCRNISKLHYSVDENICMKSQLSTVPMILESALKTLPSLSFQ